MRLPVQSQEGAGETVAASLWAKGVGQEVPQPEGILPQVPVPSFIEVPRAPRPWAVSSLALPGSSALWTSSFSFCCFSRIVSWADLEMVTWIWHKVKANAITLGGPNCAFYAFIHSSVCQSLFWE